MISVKGKTGQGVVGTIAFGRIMRDWLIGQ